MKSTVVLVCLIGLTALTSPAVASLYLYEDSIAGDGGGITATDGWNSTSTVLTWDIDRNGTNWDYEYTFTVPEKGISHIVFEVSDNFTQANVWGAYGYTGTVGDYTVKNGNPDMPEPYIVPGLKFEPSGPEAPESLSWTIHFTSDRSPMWGNFYAKDGTDGEGEDKINVTAWNTHFDEILTGSALYDEYTDLWKVAVPDTHVVPLPASILLAGFALGLAGRRLRKSV